MSSCAVPVIRIQPAGQVTPASDASVTPANSTIQPPAATPSPMQVTMTTVVYGVLAGVVGGIGLGWLWFSAPKAPQRYWGQSSSPPYDLGLRQPIPPG